MTTTTTHHPAATLRKARALIENPDHWVKGQYILIREDGSECFCAEGAFDQAGSDDLLYLSGETDDDHWATTHWFLEMALPGTFHSVEEFNDNVYTTHADVLALFDRAIAAAEAAK